MHRLRAMLRGVLGRRASMHSHRSSQRQRDYRNADREARFGAGGYERFVAAASHPARRWSRMRGVQSLLAGVPGGELHHDGAGRYRPPVAKLGTKDGRMSISTCASFSDCQYLYVEGAPSYRLVTWF